MARRSMQCSCGATFIIPEIPPSVLHCPSCGDVVRMQKGDGGAVPVREDIREPIRPPAPLKPYYPLILLGAGGLTLAGGLIGLVLYFVSGPPPRRPEPVRPAETRLKPYTPILPTHELAPTPEGPKPIEAPKASRPLPPPPKAFDSNETQSRLHALVARANLEGIVGTLLFLENRQDEYREVQAALTRDDTEIQKLVAQLTEHKVVSPIKEYFKPGDVMTAFIQAGLDPANPRPFAEELKLWLTTVHPGTPAHATVTRGGRSFLVQMWFADFKDELLDLVARSTGRTRSGAPLVIPLADAAREAERRLAALHPYYRKALGETELARLASLLKEGQGTPDDAEFLRGRLPAYCSKSESELAGFGIKVSELEAAIATAVSFDTVVFKDGRKIQGQVEEETAEFVRIKGKFGGITANKAEVLRIEPGSQLSTEFRKRYDLARVKTAELLPLLAWCKEKNLTLQRDLVAYAILKGDPGSDPAWNALGVADRALISTGPEFDIVWLHDGSKREGILTGDTEAGVQMEVIVRGAKGEVMGTGKVVVARADVAKIERMSEAARKRAKERTASFVNRAARTKEALARISLAPDVVQGMNGHKTSGTLFELHSTCPPDQVRETASVLEEVFNAYRRLFSVRRNPSKRIDVYFMANESEYEVFQKATRGGVSLAPAYFDTQLNHIAAFNGVQKTEEARVRAAILKSETDIERFKKDVASEEDRINKQVRTIRQKILDDANLARKNFPDSASQASIDRWKAENLKELKAQEKTAMDGLAKYRRDANQAIANLEEAIRYNQSVLVNQTRAMYEIFFHEAFHAFAANFLWEEKDNAGLPRWLHEGMASYYERSAVEAGELTAGGAHPTFLPLLKTLQRENGMIPLGSLVSAGAEMFQIQHTGEIPRQASAYAHAWGLAHYLISRGVTREQLEAYVTDVSTGRDRVKSFETLAGRKIPEIEAEWKAHLNSMK